MRIGLVVGVAVVALLGAGIFLTSVHAPATPAHPKPPELYVAGDSIGVGIALAGHLHSVAVVGAPMSRAAAQLQDVPDGATVIVSVGTNDALAGKTSGVLKPYLAAARAKSLRLVFVGPPCIKARWENRSLAFSNWLEANVAEHVQLRSKEICAQARSPDGVHFTPAGYGVLWSTVEAAIQ